ncbi:MAG: phage tail tape measure protein [bacterium]|nr:phage tail tape measure protein [bacterium]
MANKKFNMSVLFEVVDRYTKPVRGFGKTTNAVKNILKGFGKRLEGIKTQLKKVGVAARSAGRKLAGFGRGLKSELAGMVPMKTSVVALGAAAVMMSVSFNKAMANVATLIPNSTKRVLELKSSVQGLAVDLGKSTDDLAGGLYQVISAFGDDKDTMSRLKVSAKAAAAGLATTTEAVNLLSAVTKGYNKTNSAAIQKVGDLAFMTVKLGQTDFPALAASMGRVVPFASKLKVSQEELFAGFATLTGVTGNAAEVSTQLAAVTKAMLKPTTTMTGAAKALGYESSVQMMKQNGLIETLKLLSKWTGGSEKKTAKLFGRAEALTAVFALTGEQASNYTKKLKEMEHTSGTLDTALKEQTKGLNEAGANWEKFKALIQVTAQQAGDIVLPALNGLLKYGIIPLINGFKNLLNGDYFKALWANIKEVPAFLSELDTKLQKMSPDSYKKGFLGMMDQEGNKKFNQAAFISAKGRFQEMNKGMGMGSDKADELFKDFFKKSETEVKIKVESGEGTKATIENIKKKGKPSKVDIVSAGYLGQTLPGGVQ